MSNPEPQVLYPRRQLIRTLLRVGIGLAFAAVAKIRIEGRENLPETGPAILVGNHFSFLDPLTLIHILPHPMEFFGGFTNPYAPKWTRVFTDLWGTIRVRRGSSSRDALKFARSILEQKGFMGIFPEGGNWARVLRPPRPGAALLALQTNATVVPIGLDGFTEILPGYQLLKPASAMIRIGVPFRPQLDPALPLREQMDAAGHEMMRKIAELIPPSRQGYYSPDPAIREAAKGTEIYPWANASEG